MPWRIEKTKPENIREELKGKIEQYVLFGGQFPLAELSVEKGKLAVFIAHFPLDEDDTAAAFRQLRKASGTIDPVFTLTQLTSDDTGLPLLDEFEGASVLKTFFLQEVNR